MIALRCAEFRCIAADDGVKQLAHFFSQEVFIRIGMPTGGDLRWYPHIDRMGRHPILVGASGINLPSHPCRGRMSFLLAQARSPRLASAREPLGARAVTTPRPMTR